MSEAQYRAAVQHYEAAWNERDPQRRASELELAWGADALYVDEDVPEGVRGRDALGALIASEHADEPGLVITTTRALVLLGDRGWLQWASQSDRGTTLSGTDFIEFSPDGLIARLTDFLDAEA